VTGDPGRDLSNDAPLADVADVPDVPDVSDAPDIADVVPDPGPTDAPDVVEPDEVAPDTVTPTWPDLALNEVACHGGEWIELVNRASHDADAGGWSLTDGDDDSVPYVLPAGSMVAAGGHLVVRRQTPSADGLLFGLACGKDRVALLRPDGHEVDAVALPGALPYWTWGRLPDATGAWTETLATPGATNLPAEDPADPFFAPLQVLRVDLSLDEAARQSLFAAPYEYVHGTLQIVEPAELATPPLEVGVRLKGVYGSFRDLNGKAAFRIDVERVHDGQRLRGLHHLVFNNYVQDPSCLHEIVAYRIFGQAGVPSPRVGHAWLRVNGEDYGLYAHVEAYDEVFLGKHFPTTGHLYEGEYGADLVPWATLEVDEGDEGDTSDLDALKATSTLEQDAWLAAVTPLADLDEMRRMWAVEQYIGHWDGYAPTINNYFVHSDDAGRFTMLPWGTDQTFADHRGFLDGGGVLFARCRDVPECRPAYLQAVADVTALVQSLDLDPWIVELAAFLTPLAEQDPRRPFSMDDMAATVQATRDFLAQRSGEATTWLGCFLTPGVDADGDGATCEQDCDDQDAERYPGAIDVCGDGIDQDCDTVVDNGPECPDCSPLSAGGATYWRCPNALPWAAAEAHCQGLGGHLLVLGSEAEDQALAAAWPDFGWWNGWLGLTDAAEEGLWLTVDGQPVGWTAWAGGEPNNSGGSEHCAERWGTYSWNDCSCTDVRPFLCEAPCTEEPVDADGDGYASVATCGVDCNDDDPAVHPGAAEVCGDGIDQDCNGKIDEYPVCPLPCAMIERFGRTYAFCPAFLHWPAAAAECAQRGMVLAAPGDEAEDRWIRETTYASGMDGSAYWLGFTDEGHEGVFLDADGNPPTWTNWLPSQPDDPGSFEDCVATGTNWFAWLDVWCGEQHPYVCEPPCVAIDGDGDGAGSCGGDCDDADPTAAPGLPEVCDDAIDQDCSGAPDDTFECTGQCLFLPYKAWSFAYCPKPGPQDAARTSCLAMGEGWDLAWFNDDDVAGQIQSVRSTVEMMGHVPHAAWVGLQGVDDTWTWPDGSSPTAAPWAPGQPDGAGSCVIADDTGAMDDRACTDAFGWICRGPDKIWPPLE
jgi:hypothetical protein